MAAHIWFQLTTHFIDPERMKGWVGLVGWPVADGVPTLVVTHQLQVERRTGKVRRPETDVLPLCHATNISDISTVLTVTARRISPYRWKILPERVTRAISTLWTYFATASRRYTGDSHNSVRSWFVYDTYNTMEETRLSHGWMHVFTHRPTVTLQLHDFNVFRTCRTSSFCTVAWQ